MRDVRRGPAPARDGRARSETRRRAPSLADLRRLVDEQRAALEGHQALLEEQKRRLDDQGREIAELRTKLDETSALALSSRNELAQLREKSPEPSVPATVEERLARMEQDVQKLPELAETTVTAGEFRGSLAHPRHATPRCESEGGFAWRRSARFDAIGTDDRFVTSSIPVEGSEAARKGDRTTYSARPAPLQLRPAHANGGRRHARVHRGRFRRLRQLLLAPPRLRPVAEDHRRADLVDVLQPRGRAGRDRLRGPERDLALPAAAVPLDASGE